MINLSAALNGPGRKVTFKLLATFPMGTDKSKLINLLQMVISGFIGSIASSR
jgi:hypothetical protein